MKYILSKEEQGLIHLLQVAIGTSEKTMLPVEMDWQRLFDISESHGVNAVVVDGIGKLDLDSIGLKDVTRDIAVRRIKCIGLALKTEYEYTKKLIAAGKLINLWKSFGIRTIVLKGFVTCQYYPNPKHRFFCDFDCFLCGDFEKGNDIIRQKGIEVKGSYKHKTFNFEGMHVENHQYCTHFRGRDKARSFEELLENYMLSENPLYINGTQIEMPNPMFNALFMLWHIRSHFFEEKVTLRQLLDWALLMNFYKRNGVDWNKFQSICEEYGLLRFAQAMTRVACKCFAVDECFLCEANDEDDDSLIRDIFSNEHIHVQYGTGMKAQVQVLRNKLMYNWKYYRFSDQSIWGALWQQINGLLVDRNPLIYKKVGTNFV